MKFIVDSLPLYEQDCPFSNVCQCEDNKMYDNNSKRLEMINKTTLRTLIWAEGIPHRDKIEACDTYLGLGFNSETKLYCEKLLQDEFK